MNSKYMVASIIVKESQRAKIVPVRDLICAGTSSYKYRNPTETLPAENAPIKKSISDVKYSDFDTINM